MATKKVAKAKTHYVIPGADNSGHWKAGASALVFAFQGGGTHTIQLSDFPEALIPGLAFHGLGQKLRDTYAGDETVAEAEESFENMLGQLKEGNWVSERASLGPSPVMVLEAIAAAKAEAGLPHDAEAAKEKYKTKEAREAALAVPAVKKHYERLRAERQAERQKKADAAAAENPGDVAAL